MNIVENLKSEFDGNHQRRRLQVAVGALTIVLLAFAVYLPILPGSFLMDDERLTGSDNALVNGQFTPYSLWFQTDFTLATFGWWLEHLAFGQNPAGYHAVNIALQALSALLFWRLLAQLKIPGAWLAAALFAIHPVCVNSVARIAELKNTLSMPLFLLSFIAYLRYEAIVLYPTDPVSNGKPSRLAATFWYALALIAFILALLAKTTVAMLPVVILLCAAWQRGRIQWKDMLHSAPFFAPSLAFGLMSIWFQKNQALPTSEWTLQPASFQQRLAWAGRDVWFYLDKALLPFHLNIEYPRWKTDAGAIAWLPDLLLCALFVLCWRFRHSWGRHTLFGLGCFAAMLFPGLGFFDAQFLTLWNVSDHLQYAALPAILSLVGAALAAASNQNIFRCAAVASLLGAAALCFQRAEVFKTPERLMADTIAKNPSAWGAHNDLGVILARRGNYPAALREFQLSLEYNPDNVDARVNLGHALLLQGRLAEAQAQLLAALKARPRAPIAHTMYANLLKREGRNAEALYHLRLAVIFAPDAETCENLASLDYAIGNWREAAAQFRKALAFKPAAERAAILNNLAWILATCPDDSVREGTEAVRCAQEACRLTSFKQPGMLGTLAAAYAEARRFPDAVTTAETAVTLATDAGDVPFANANRQLLLLYRAGKPYHEKTPAGSSPKK